MPNVLLSLSIPQNIKPLQSYAVTSNQPHQSRDEYKKLLVWLSLVRVRSYVLSCLCLEILFFTSTCLRILVPWSRWPKSGKPSKGQYIIISAFFISTSHFSWFRRWCSASDRSRRWFFNHDAHHRDEHRRFCNKQKRVTTSMIQSSDVQIYTDEHWSDSKSERQVTLW